MIAQKACLLETQKTAVFTKKNRLLLPRQFQHVFKNGKRLKGSFFVFVFCHNEEKAARLGLAIAKRVIGRAFARNKVKRMIRESFRQHQALLNGMDVVVMVKGDIHKESRAALFEELSKKWPLIAKYHKKSY